jgi:phosphate transport system substrate-binding protein
LICKKEEIKLKISKKMWMLVLTLVLVFSLAACGGAAEEPGEDASGEALEGAVIVDGSGTVYPLMAHIAEEYMTNEQSGVSVQVGRAGSSAGFKKFIPGETDFSDASRKIKDEEISQLEEQGLMFGEDVMEVKLAYDGLTIVINKDNDWATEMTDEEIVNMYLSGKYSEDDVVLWSDIRPEWPAEQINFTDRMRTMVLMSSSMK